MGQYPFAAIVGKVIDRYGPWASSLAASVLFFFGFGLFALEIAKSPDDIIAPSQSSFYHLVFFFLMTGLGVAFSYVRRKTLAWYSDGMGLIQIFFLSFRSLKEFSSIYRDRFWHKFGFIRSIAILFVSTCLKILH